MRLDQVMAMEGTENFYIWWYGADYPASNFNENGYLQEFVHVPKGVEIENRIYLVLHGIDAYRSRYKFAIKLTRHEKDNNYSWEKVLLS